MEINGKDDRFARWLQGLCAIPLFGAVVVVIRMLKDLDPRDIQKSYWLWGALIGLNFLMLRCLWYALTGTGNINRDVLNDTNVGGDQFNLDD